MKFAWKDCLKGLKQWGVACVARVMTLLDNRSGGGPDVVRPTMMGQSSDHWFLRCWVWHVVSPDEVLSGGMYRRRVGTNRLIMDRPLELRDDN